MSLAGGRRVVVVGVGLVLPGARSEDELWTLLASGRTATAAIDRFPTDRYATRHAGMVDDAEIERIPRRLRKQMDRFCQMSVLAAREALEDAGLAALGDAGRVGVYVGNMFGGWQITEPSLRELLQVGLSGVSPYVATSWFPTAPQGQISIDRGLKGFSKTMATDTASAALAVGYAARAIAEDRADVMLAGGAEAPVTPYTYTFCETSGRMTAGDYTPFSSAADGFRVGEGAVMVALESERSARARGVPILAEVAGFAAGHARRDAVFADTGAQVLARLGRRALEEAGLQAGDVDLVALDAQGTIPADQAETQALSALLGAEAASVPASTAKPATGHLLGAAPAVDLAAALLSLRRGQVPPIAGTDGGASAHELDVVVGAPRAASVRSALLHARGADGTTAATVLTAA